MATILTLLLLKGGEKAVNPAHLCVDAKGEVEEPIPQMIEKALTLIGRMCEKCMRKNMGCPLELNESLECDLYEITLILDKIHEISSFLL